MNEILTNLAKVIPQLFILAAVFGFIGWSLRGLGSKPAAANSTKPAPAKEKSQGSERAKNLETALEKSRSAHKALKSEFDQLKAGSVSQESLDQATAELEAARSSLEAESRRTAALEADLKKAQDTNKSLNTRVNEMDKAQKDRSFTLENELSKTREQLAILQNRPDDTAELHAEIERLRESVATTTRFAGELRKREAGAVEALEKAEARLTGALQAGGDIPAQAKKVGPVVESTRVAAAKAEVLRLVEENRKKEQALATAEPEAPVVVAEEPAAVAEKAVAVVEEPVAVVEVPVAVAAEPVAVAEEPSTASEEPAEKTEASEKKTPSTGDLFSMD